MIQILATLALLIPVQDEGLLAEREFLRGKAALRDGSPDKAIDHFETALDHVPDHTLVLGSLADAWEKKGNLEKSIDYWKQALVILESGIRLTNPEKKLKKEIKENLKKHDIVTPEFRKVAETLVALGKKWFAKKRFGAAARAFEQALALDPENKTALDSMEKVDEKLGTGGIDFLNEGDSWVPTLGKDVKRAEGGIAINSPEGPTHIMKPDLLSGAVDLNVAFKIDKVNTSKENVDLGISVIAKEARDYTGPGNLLVVFRSAKDGDTLRAYIQENNAWKKLGTEKVRVPVSHGRTFHLVVKLRPGALQVQLVTEGKIVGALTRKAKVPDELKLGIWAQHVAVTLTKANAKSR